MPITLTPQSKDRLAEWIKKNCNHMLHTGDMPHLKGSLYTKGERIENYTLCK